MRRDSSMIKSYDIVNEGWLKHENSSLGNNKIWVKSWCVLTKSDKSFLHISFG
eukprot:UN11111